MINYLYPIVFLSTAIYLFKLYYNLKDFKDDYSPKTINTIFLVKNFISSYSNLILKFFPFFLVVTFSFFFIRKDFSFLFFYGFFLFVVYSFFDFAILFVVSLLSRAIDTSYEDKLKSFFVISKFLNLLIIVFFLYSFYLKVGNNYDYPIIIFSPLFIGYLFNVISKAEKNFLFFSNSLIFSFVFLILITFGFRYLSMDYVSYIVVLWSLFVFFALLEKVFEKLMFFSKNLLLNRFFISVLYPFFVTLAIYKNFKLNLFVSLVFYIAYIILFFFFELRREFKKSLNLILALIFITLLFISKMFYVFVVGISYEKMVILIIMLLLPLIYYFLKEEQYLVIKYIFKDEIDLLDLNFIFKNVLFFTIFLSCFAFKIAYDYMVVYYGYSDSFNFISIIIPLLFFYLFENYSPLVKKLDNILLDSLLNISIMIFSYSSQIVILSYLFGLNYVNLVSIFCLYSFLSFYYSSNIVNSFISMIYLLAVYIIIYV